MLLLKQLRFVNLKAVQSLSPAVHQTSTFNKNVANLSYSSWNSNAAANLNTNIGFNIPNILMTRTPNLVNIRHHYRNYEYHPSRIVRAYRKTRTWLTDHFVLAENRFENIYSFAFLATIGILMIFVGWLNLQLGGEAGGFDVNRLPSDPFDNNKK